MRHALKHRRHLRVAPRRKRKPAPLSMEQVEPAFRGAIVTAARSRDKKRARPTEMQIRELRFIWQRGNLTTTDLPSLAWINTGLLVCKRLLFVDTKDSTARIELTEAGVAWAVGKVQPVRTA